MAISRYACGRCPGAMWSRVRWNFQCLPHKQLLPPGVGLYPLTPQRQFVRGAGWAVVGHASLARGQPADVCARSVLVPSPPFRTWDACDAAHLRSSTVGERARAPDEQTEVVLTVSAEKGLPCRGRTFRA